MQRDPSWVLVQFPAMRCKTIGRNRGDCCILLEARKPKWKSVLKRRPMETLKRTISDKWQANPQTTIPVTGGSMTIRFSAFVAQAIVFTWLAFLPQPAICSVLFENKIRDLLASGPVG